jgi:hypothetical protein
MSEQPEQSGQAGSSPAAVHRFTLSDAATACGVSRSRIRRMLDAGAFPNATREEVPGKGASAAPWYIPASDLLAAGLFPNRPTDTPANGPQSVRDVSEQAAGRVAEQELAQLRHELALERTRRIAAEDLARERERTIGGLELALRLLEANNPPSPAPGLPATPSQATQGPSPADRTGGIGETTAGAPAAPGEAVSWWARFRARMRD